ncbi:MAG: hypothetical protein QF503_12745, partial [Rhodospirillales bacterium]|nr:hypothetical protein [Rhodospirillales bacterium]
MAQGTVRQQGRDVDLSRPDPTRPTTTIQSRAAVEPTQAMRDLVRDISKYGRCFNQNFVVLTQGGLDLLEKVDAVDGTIRSTATTY